MWGCGQNATWTALNIPGLSDMMFFPDKAQSDFQQPIYRNVQLEQVTESEGCDEPKCSDRPCDQSCDHEEQEEPLMKTNNYQFCWVQPRTGKPIWLVNKQWDSWISRGTAARLVHRTVAAISFLFCFSVLLLFASGRQTDKLLQKKTCDLLLCRAWRRFATLVQPNVDPEKGHMETNHKASKAALL